MSRLRNDLDKLRCDSITCKLPPHSPASCAETIRPLSPSPKCYTPFKPVVAKPSEADFGGTKLVPLLAEFEEESLLADFFQLACRTEPELQGSQSDDEKFYGMFTKAMAQKPTSPVEPQFPSSSETTDSRGRSSSFSGGISRASDQATGLRRRPYGRFAFLSVNAVILCQALLSPPLESRNWEAKWHSHFQADLCLGQEA